MSQVRRIHKLYRISGKPHLFIPVGFVGIFILIGVGLLLFSHAATPLVGDLNGDGTVNGADLAIFLAHWAQSGTNLPGDFTGDGTVNGADLAIFLGNFGQSTAGGGTSNGYTGSCDKTISPGTDVGTAVNGMNPGQVLCLNSGTYGSINTVDTITKSGTSSAPITVTSAPGQTATIVGAHYWEASYITVEYLNIDNSNNQYNSNGGSNPPPCAFPVSEGMEIDGTGDILQYDNIYGATASLRGVLIGLGWNSPANNTIIRYNKISDAGSCNQTQHLIYVDSGSGSQIYDNWMWNDHYGYAVQLYPKPSNTKVYSNVIDNVLDGTVEATSGSGNQTYNNVIENSVIMSGFHSGYMINCLNAGGDTVNNNASWNNPNGLGLPCSGVTATGNITLSADPFVNSASHNYALSSTAPASLKAYNLWDGVGPPVPDPAP